MAIIANYPNTFLTGLSDFWHRFFADTGTVKTVYEATAIQLGQAYLNLLHEALNPVLADAPVFRKEYYRLISVREDQVDYVEGPPGLFRFAVRAPELASVQFLQDRIFNPFVSLERGLDFQVHQGALLFSDDPLETAAKGVARRSVSTPVGGIFRDHTATWGASGVKRGDYLEAFGRKFRVIRVSETALLLDGRTPFPAGEAFEGDTAWVVTRRLPEGGWQTIATSSAQSGAIQRVVRELLDEYAFWGVNATVDERVLYENFGHLFGAPRASSEAYRAFLRGISQLYMMGPAIERIESALSVVLGLPVIRSDGEVLKGHTGGILAVGDPGEGDGAAVVYEDGFWVLSIDIADPQNPPQVFSETSPGGYVLLTGAVEGAYRIYQYLTPTKVRLDVRDLTAATGLSWRYTLSNAQVVWTTDINGDEQRYQFPIGVPLRWDILDNQYNGHLRFSAFETMTNAVIVDDWHSNPEWWHAITIPEALMPGRDEAGRLVSPALAENAIGDVSGWRVADPGFFIGADEDGLVGNYDLTKPIWHHLPTYILMDRFIKRHLFRIALHPSVDELHVDTNELRRLAVEVKPAGTYMLFT